MRGNLNPYFPNVIFLKQKFKALNNCNDMQGVA